MSSNKKSLTLEELAREVRESQLKTEEGQRKL